MLVIRCNESLIVIRDTERVSTQLVVFVILMGPEVFEELLKKVFAMPVEMHRYLFGRFILTSFIFFF
jgi:hypothetical protein